MIYAVDFDNTIATGSYPEVGVAVPLALDKLREMTAKGHKILINTCRSGHSLELAVQWLIRHGIVLYEVNVNPDQASWSTSPKVFADVYIDDRAYGCPKIHFRGETVVDWTRISIPT